MRKVHLSSWQRLIFAPMLLIETLFLPLRFHSFDFSFSFVNVILLSTRSFPHVDKYLLVSISWQVSFFFFFLLWHSNQYYFSQIAILFCPLSSIWHGYHHPLNFLFSSALISSYLIASCLLCLLHQLPSFYSVLKWRYLPRFFPYNFPLGTCLLVQQLRYCTSNARGGLKPWLGN